SWHSLKLYTFLFGVLIFLTMCTIVILNLELIYRLQAKKRGIITITNPGVIVYPLFTIAITLYFTFLGVEAVKFKKVNKDVVVSLDSLTISSKPTYYYIGKTNNFIFFYNDSTERADIYPMN